MNDHSIQGDLCVVGGGSAGIGAALSGARSGLRVILVEKGDCLGGNAVRGGVHNWEAGVGATAFPRELYERMSRIPNGAAIWSMARHCAWPDHNDPPFPGGEQLIDPSKRYEDTLQRHGTRGLKDGELLRKQIHGVMFEPEVYAAEAEAMLTETGHCLVLKNTSFQSAEFTKGRITRIKISGANGEQTIRARYFIDATADALLCRAAGCETMQGEESASRFHEPGAPEIGRERMINAVTLIYRITPADSAFIEPLPEGIPAECWHRKNWKVAAIGQYPNLDRNVNTLPTMEGPDFLDYIEQGKDGYKRAYEECKRRVYGHWHYIQTNFPEFRNFRLKWIAPTLGVRESRRVVGEYILTQLDILAGLSQQDQEDIIGITDHPLDIHGEANIGCPELAEPYGVPLRCLIPKGWANLMVAGRCASFSHIAASSCRLSRFMMDLGHAAGLAVSLAAESDGDIREVDAGAVRRKLIDQGATLEWKPRKSTVAAEPAFAS